MTLTADYIPSVNAQHVNASITVIQDARNVMIVLTALANTASKTISDCVYRQTHIQNTERSFCFHYAHDGTLRLESKQHSRPAH